MNTYGKPAKLEMVARNKPKSDVVETAVKTDLSRWTIRVDVATLNLCETEVLPGPFRGSLLRYTPTCKVTTNNNTHIARVNHPFTITRRQFN